MKKDWEIKRLGDVCDLQNGFAFKSSDYVEKSNVMNFRMSQIRPDGTMDLYHNTKYLPEDYATKYSDYLLSDGDVVIAMTDMAGDPRILGRPTIVFTDGYKVLLNQRVGKLFKFDKNIYPKFLNYMLVSPSICDYYKSLGRGGLQLNISKQDILNASIPVPPLEEQKRIVKILDEKFTQLETIKASAQTNLQNAKDLFQSQLTKAFSNTTLGKKRLGEVCEIITGPFGSSIHKTDYVPNGIPMINPQSIVDEKIIPLEKCLVSENAAKTLERFKLIENDIVIARRGEMGRCAVIRKENENWLCGTGSFIIRSDLRTVNSDFLQKVLSSKESKQKLEKESIGATMSNLNQGILRNFEISLPPLPEQKRIVKELDTLSEKVRQLQEIYTKQIANCDELKQAYLQKAFEGEL